MAGSAQLGASPLGPVHVQIPHWLQAGMPSWRRPGMGAAPRLSWPTLPAQMAEILQELFQELPYIVFTSILQTTMKAVTVLGTQHTQQTVEVMLSLCPPSER